MAKYSGGCEHVHTSADKDPIDNHTCHCSVCKRVTGQATTHVVFFNHGDLKVDNVAGLKRQPFNDQNPKGPLELCTCAKCGKPIMLDDKQKRIRVIVPNIMGYDEKKLPADLSRVLRLEDRCVEANGRSPRLRRAAPRVRLAEGRSGLISLHPHARNGRGDATPRECDARQPQSSTQSCC